MGSEGVSAGSIKRIYKGEPMLDSSSDMFLAHEDYEDRTMKENKIYKKYWESEEKKKNNKNAGNVPAEQQELLANQVDDVEDEDAEDATAGGTKKALTDDAFAAVEFIVPSTLAENEHYKRIMRYLRVVFLDLCVVLFLASQELVDSSNLVQLCMNARFTTGSIVFGSIWAHLIVNVVFIGVVYLFSAHCLSMLEGVAIASIVVYFICFYEFLFSILLQLGYYLNIDSIYNAP